MCVYELIWTFQFIKSLKLYNGSFAEDGFLAAL